MAVISNCPFCGSSQVKPLECEDPYPEVDFGFCGETEGGIARKAVCKQDEVTRYIHYQEISKISPESLSILFLPDDNTSIMAKLRVLENGTLFREETYQSLKEFSTVSMKEALVLYAKRTIIKSDPSFFKEDDPKLHAFLSKLSYTGIEAVCKNLNDFAMQFKQGHITLQLPKVNPRPKR